jgi:trichoplein keratin filament-binding protein
VKVKKAEPSTTVPLTKEALAKKRQELHAREKSIREGPSRLEKQRDALKLREDRVKLDEQERALRRPKSPEEMEMLERGERLTALENEQTEAERLRKEEAELLRPESEGEKANQAKKAKLDEIKKRKEGDQDRAKKRKQIEEMKRKLSGQLTPEERADQELEDELAALKKEQDEAAKMRQFERERKPLNPQGKSLTQILGGRRF